MQHRLAEFHGYLRDTCPREQKRENIERKIMESRRKKHHVLERPQSHTIEVLSDLRCIIPNEVPSIHQMRLASTVCKRRFRMNAWKWISEG